MKHERGRTPDGGESPSQTGESICAEIRDLLSPALDGEATIAEEARVARHLAECRGCSEARRVEQSVRRAAAVRLHRAPGPRRRPSDVVRSVRRESDRRDRASGIRRLAAAASILFLVWLGAAISLRDPLRSELPSEEILVNLDVLQDIQEQGIEPTAELLELLLETASNESNAKPDSEWIDLEIFEFLLEEEVLPESL